ncbi:MAG: twin-arginine translocase TatA/TatE family subunit [Bacteroidales bacterium]|nr:twin-arginine translocase TatA/TatE family subunit [Bacteroidales bacterium]
MLFLSLLFISGPEIFVVLVVVLMLFGAKKIPEIARGLGKGINEFKRATEDIKRELQDGAGEVGKDIKEISDSIKKS